MEAKKKIAREKKAIQCKILEAFVLVIDFAVCLKEESVFLVKIQDWP